MKKQPLKGARCYLGGPIENDATGHNWRAEPSRILVERYGIDLFDPFADPKQQWVPQLYAAREHKDFEKMREIAMDFVQKDLTMIDHTDMLISYLPKGVPTTGTHHEIIRASDAKKPVMLVCPQGKEFVPLWYYGFIRHERMFGSWQDLYAYLDEVSDGKHTEERRWRYLYGLI